MFLDSINSAMCIIGWFTVICTTLAVIASLIINHVTRK